MPPNPVISLPTVRVTFYRQEGDGGESQLRMMLEKTMGFLTVTASSSGIETVYTPGEITSLDFVATPALPPKPPQPEKTSTGVIVGPPATIIFDGDVFITQTVTFTYSDGSQNSYIMFYDPAVDTFFYHVPPLNGAPDFWVSHPNNSSPSGAMFPGPWSPSSPPFPVHRPNGGGAGGQQN